MSKSKKVFLILFLLIAPILISVFNIPIVKGSNIDYLIDNGDFEEGDGENPDYWTYNTSDLYRIRRVNSQCNSGCWSYELWSNINDFLIAYSNYFGVEEGEVYKLSIWIKKNIPYGGETEETHNYYYIILRVKNSTKEVSIPINEYGIKEEWGEEGWKQRSCFFKVPEGYNYDQGRLALNLKMKNLVNGSGLVYFDRVEFDKLGLIDNPSFEFGSDYNPDNWTYTNTDTVKMMRVNDTVHTGDWSYKIWGNETTFKIAYSDYFTIKEDGFYNLSGYFKYNLTSGNKAYIVLRIKNGAEISYTPESYICWYGPDEKDWFFESIVFQIPEGYDIARLSLNLKMTTIEDGPNIFYSDNLDISPIGDIRINSKDVITHTENRDFTFYFRVIDEVYQKSGVSKNDVNIYLKYDKINPDSITFDSELDSWKVTGKIPDNIECGNYRVTMGIGDIISKYGLRLKIYEEVEDFYFVVLGDCHLDYDNGENNFRDMVEILNVLDPAFVLHMGDIITDDISYFEFYKEIIDGLNMPIFVVTGNHDVGVDSKEESWQEWVWGDSDLFNAYSFDYGDFHFIGANTGAHPYDSNGTMSDEQYNWILNDCEENKDKKIFMGYHQSICDNWHGNQYYYHWDNVTMVNRLKKLSDDYNIKATFNGHSHRWSFNEIDYNEDGDKEIYYTLNAIVNFTSQHSEFDHVGFSLIEIKNNEWKQNIGEAKGAIWTHHYPDLEQIFFAYSSLRNITILSKYGNYSDFPVIIEKEAIYPSPIYVELNLEKDAVNSIVWSFDEEKRMVEIKYVSESSSTGDNLVYVGDYGYPSWVDNVISWEYILEEEIVSFKVLYSNTVRIYFPEPPSWFEIRIPFFMGLIGLILIVSGPTYGIYKIRSDELEGIIWAFMMMVFGFALVIGWLWG